MRDGPRGFGQDYSCPALLRWRLKRDRLPVRGCHPLCRRFPDGFPFPRAPSTGAPTTPGRPQPPRFGLIPFRSPLLGESMFLSFPAGIEMFQFPALAPLAGCAPSKRAGCPIRTPPDQVALADPRGVSPLDASFVASGSQGIRRVPFSRLSLAARRRGRPTRRARSREPRPRAFDARGRYLSVSLFSLV